MSVLKRKDYFEIGKTGTADEFLHAFKKRMKGASYEAMDDGTNKLRRGALEAFLEGRPENIQAILLNAEDLDQPNLAAHTLLDIAEASDNKLHAIMLSLEGLYGAQKEACLSKALQNAIRNHVGDEDFYALLLQAGADPNGGSSNSHGTTLFVAVDKGSPATVKLLHEHGASFDVAISWAEKRAQSKELLDRLNYYKENIEGRPDDLIEIRQETLDLLMDQVRELTERVYSAPAPKQKKDKAAKKKHGGKKHPARLTRII